MIPLVRARSLLWLVLVVAGAGALGFAALRVVRSRAGPVTAPAAMPEAPGKGDGVVCFGVVDLEHGLTSLYPLQPGRVAQVLVRENQAVPAGQTLLRLEDALARSRLDEADAAAKLARHSLQKARKLPEEHRKKVKEQQAILEAMRARLAAARQVLADRKQTLKQVEPPVITAIEVSAGEVQVRELEALERVEAERSAGLEGQDVELETERAEIELKAAEARLEQARLALKECRLDAPESGRVLRVLVGPGDVLGGQQGQPAVLFAADGPQVIRATVEQEFAARVQEGQPALIEDDSNATDTSWRGRVERLAGWYSQRRTVLHDPSQMSDVRTLECVIMLEPGQPRLRLGQSVRVWIGAKPR
jgi:multidrug resistance efflux pump